MENQVFLRPAVAGPLKEGFVEARLHVDIRRNLTAEQLAANQQLERDLAQTSAMPTFVVVDPATEQVLGIHNLSGTDWESPFIEFLSRVRP